MIKNFRIAIVVFSLAVGFSACNKDDETGKPEISNFELGYDNSKTVSAGSDLHMEAAVLAEGKISTIQVTIHPEGDHLKSTSFPLDQEGWEFDSTYIKFSGLRNTTFHEHIEVPLSASAGTYHFHFIVTDMEGYQTEKEEDLVVEPAESSQASIVR